MGRVLINAGIGRCLRLLALQRLAVSNLRLARPKPAAVFSKVSNLPTCGGMTTPLPELLERAWSEAFAGRESAERNAIMRAIRELTIARRDRGRRLWVRRLAPVDYSRRGAGSASC